MRTIVRSALKFVALAVVFAFCHAILLGSILSFLAERGIHRLDHPEIPVATVDRVGRGLVRVLAEPYESLERIADLPEGWPSVIPQLAGNLIWGSVAALLFLKLVRVRARRAQRQGQ